ncbi:MAG TPA: glycine--tRNA ligase [Chthoniobacterales bacterium]|jgi:glycyl-tRNA synthetase
MPMSKPPTDAQRMEKIVSLCKRRGFIFQSSEIYGGLNGAWDYGPLGVELKRNLKNYWWRTMVHGRDDVVGMDGSILMNRAVWQATGHEETFSDPMVDSLLTGKRYRADQIEPQSGTVYYYSGAFSVTDDDWPALQQIGPASPLNHLISTAAVIPAPSTQRITFDYDRPMDLAAADLVRSFDPSAYELLKNKVYPVIFLVLVPLGKPPESARRIAREFYQKRGLIRPVLIGEASERIDSESPLAKLFDPESGALLSKPQSFNLMFKTHIGATEDESSLTYLRPETAQSIFVQFKNVLETSRKKLPFGIAQIGKAFRNEINPRNFTFRSREFEQMELEYFCRPEQGMELLEYWKEQRLKFYESIGIPRAKLHVLTVPDEERAFYSKGTYDIEYEFPFGRQELEGVAYRTDYDLSQHQRASGKPLEYFDEETKQKFIPHVVEPSAGVDRTILALICEAYSEDEAPDDKGKMETRTVLRFHPRMAPFKCAVFPLLKNKPELVEKAKQIVELLRPHMYVFYDETGAIGRRYRRQDEIGTPFAVTVDFETMGERDASLRDTVTLRERDTMKQERVAIADLVQLLAARLT